LPILNEKSAHRAIALPLERATKSFRAWPILHVCQHFYVNWQLRQIGQWLDKWVF